MGSDLASLRVPSGFLRCALVILGPFLAFRVPLALGLGRIESLQRLHGLLARTGSHPSQHLHRRPGIEDRRGPNEDGCVALGGLYITEFAEDLPWQGHLTALDLSPEIVAAHLHVQTSDKCLDRCKASVWVHHDFAGRYGSRHRVW